MTFTAKTVYLLGAAEFPTAQICFTNIELTPGTHWAAMRFEAGQTIRVEPLQPVHGVLLMKEDGKATISFTMQLAGMEYEIMLQVGEKLYTSYARSAPGVVDIITHDLVDHCVWFLFKKTAKVVNFEARPAQAEKLAR